jgi:phosphopantetheinyl transferase (holo-ACP synthase)
MEEFSGLHKIHISFSHEEDTAVAFIVIENCLI